MCFFKNLCRSLFFKVKISEDHCPRCWSSVLCFKYICISSKLQLNYNCIYHAHIYFARPENPNFSFQDGGSLSEDDRHADNDLEKKVWISIWPLALSSYFVLNAMSQDQHLGSGLLCPCVLGEDTLEKSNLESQDLLDMCRFDVRVPCALTALAVSSNVQLGTT